MTNLGFFDPLVRLVTTSGTPVRLSPYQVAATISFTRNTGGVADTISDSGSGFLVAGFQPGDFITVAGTTNNNTTTGYEIASLTSGTITLVVSGRLTTEAAGASVTLDTVHGLKVPDGVEVTVRSRTGNTGVITVAPTSARAVNTVAGYQRHARLEQSQSVGTEVKNLKDLWIDSTISNEGVEILFER